jgi:hypothetical protein
MVKAGLAAKTTEHSTGVEKGPLSQSHIQILEHFSTSSFQTHEMAFIEVQNEVLQAFSLEVQT